MGWPLGMLRFQDVRFSVLHRKNAVTVGQGQIEEPDHFPDRLGVGLVLLHE